MIIGSKLQPSLFMLVVSGPVHAVRYESMNWTGMNRTEKLVNSLHIIENCEKQQEIGDFAWISHF